MSMIVWKRSAIQRLQCGTKEETLSGLFGGKENYKMTTKEMLDVEDLAEFCMGSSVLLLPRKRWDVLQYKDILGCGGSMLLWAYVKISQREVSVLPIITGKLLPDQQPCTSIVGAMKELGNGLV
ncbi:BA75_04225T0 [Komagataella pastoris]|uniref:BA75_04225T0 n=1 Tax=Komagataella pastoris TaxID=4922 RepID=A0A1B2JG89_PICPA|nr:BA75_04225T0 [Komagataella pastoris]